VRRLARLPGVEVHGDVADLDPFLQRASVAIAPMASGSGVPMKVLEAWAAGLPVIAHPWTAAGVDAEARGALRVADGAGPWRDAVLELLSDPDVASQMSERGREVWRRRFHPERVAELLRETLLGMRDGGS
jgi:glycosyltransferase involved in cell wall biosynthesis